MRRLSFVAPVLLVLSACATSNPAPATSHPASQQLTASQPQAARSPNALTPAAATPRGIAEPRIRVGLLIDQSTVTFPRTADGYVLVGEKGASTLRRGFTATAPLANATVRYAVQMAAVSDQSSAEALAQRVRGETGLRVDVVFDPAGGAYRIFAGDFATSDEATPTRAQLTDRGYGKDMLVVRRPSDEHFTPRIEIVDDEGERATFDSANLDIFPANGETVTIDKQPYRTSARLFVNPRGLLNVVNVLNLEDYLLGVVPAEMGPTIYDEVEALKAQAVAARTYAVRNLGQFASEGYDICPGPACQAYKGFSAEADLSTKAVHGTAGLIATYEGKPIDALYTATCGGETSDVGVMFPGRNEPYLKRARCIELDLVTFEGRADSGLLNDQQVNARLFAAMAGLPDSSSSWAAGDVARAIAAALQLTGAPAPTGAPASSRRGDVLAFLASTLHLDRFGRALTLPEDRKYFFPQTPNSEDAVYATAAFLIKYGINPSQSLDRVSLTQPMPREELYALLGSWVREHNLVTDAEGKILRIDGRKVTLKQKGETTAYTLPAGIPVFRRLGDRTQEYASVPVMLGDRATITVGPGKRVAAMTVQANYDGAAFDRTSSFSNWTRSYRADELVTSINRRNPIRQLIDLRPLTVDASQRVAEMEVTAEGGRTFTLKGLPVRWSLNVPDNLFVYEKTKDADGMDRYTFYGKGWGHGVGMCQVGAYGMAFRGWTYDRILKNYYTGIDIQPIAATAAP
jgi:stage II sporulation protein D